MAIAFKSSGQVNRGNTATPALDKPGDLADGDFLLCVMAHDNGVASITTLPTGWTHIGSQDANATDAGLRLFYKYITNAAGEPSSWTWTFGASKGGTIVSYLSFTGVDSSTPIDVTSVFGAPTGTTTPTAGPITPVTNGAMLVAANATDPSSGTYTGTPTSGWTEDIQFGVSATSNLYVEHKLQATAAAISAAPTMSGTDDYATGIVALRPVATDTTPPTITGRNPTDAATDVLIGSNVVVTFSEPMSTASVDSSTFTVKPTGGSNIAGTITPSVGDTVFTFDPSTDLDYEQQYTVTVTTGVEDVAGNNLVTQSVWTFTTEDSPEPPSYNDVVVEIAFNTMADAARFDVGHFDQDFFDGTLEWTDVTQYVRSATCSRGMTRHEGIYAKAEAGRAVIELSNLDARFDPTNPDTPYLSDAGFSQVKPMRQVRIRVDDTYLWRGYIESWDIEYPEGGHDAICTINASDGIMVLSSFNAGDQVSQGANELSGARIHRILDYAGWPDDRRDIATGIIPMQATTLSQNAWAEMQITSDSENGELYLDGDNNVIFRDIFAIFDEARSNTSNATFGNGPGELGYQDVKPSYEASEIANQVKVTRVNGVTQIAEDYDSQTEYTVHTWERSDLIFTDDAYSQQLADFVLAVKKDPQFHFESLEVNPLRDPFNLFPQVWEREFGDRITIKWTPLGRDTAIERDAYIRGITHTFTPDSWLTTWVLQDTASFDEWHDS